MSRADYSDNVFYEDIWAHIRWRGAVGAAIKGKRGQRFLTDLIAAMEELPVKELIANDFTNNSGLCTLGAIALKEHIDVKDMDPDNIPFEKLSAQLKIAPALAREIMYMNDECGDWGETPEQRYDRMLKWLKGLLLSPEPRSRASS